MEHKGYKIIFPTSFDIYFWSRWKAKRKPEDDPQVELNVLKIQRRQEPSVNDDYFQSLHYVENKRSWEDCQ